MSDGEKIRGWILARAGSWRASVNNVAEMRSRRDATLDEALNSVEAYRGMARDLAAARRMVPNSRTAAALESLYAHMHTLIKRRPRGVWHSVRSALSVDIPKVTRELRVPILSMAVLMTLSALAGWWLISTFP